MNGLSKKIVVVFIIFIGFTLSACNKNGSSSKISNDNEAQTFWNDAPFGFTKSGDGYYYIGKEKVGFFKEGDDLQVIPEMVLYFDGSTQESYPVCGKAQCNHMTESCDAYLGQEYFQQSIWYYRDHLYLLRWDEKKNDVILVEFNTDCTERRDLFVIAQNSVMAGGEYGLVFHDDYVYVYDILGRQTLKDDNHISITKMALDGSSREEIFTKEAGSSQIGAVKSYGEQLMFTVTDRKYVDNTFQCEMSGIYAYSYETGKITMLLEEPVYSYCIDEVNQILYYFKFEDGLYKKNLNSDKTERIFECDDSSKLCQISYDGKYIYMSNQRMETMGIKTEGCLWTLDANGEVINKLKIPFTFFGDEKYLFGRNEDMKYIMLDKEKVKDWTELDIVIMGYE